ncbi:MAG: TIGR03619 family F420-dependent LLM class oxidoreductase [Actinomycetota bacterium]|nr:TIGR03619 family F420-dependent LLM class oxidoreductase [Actinomycetota bacterium]
MRVGIHLPQYGRVAGPDAIRTAAQRAEALGFADIWVSDHIVQPVGQDYPSPFLYDPFMTLAWGAAATERIGLGTSVLVAPQHNPLELANMLASLDALSGGRLTIGVGVGWSAGEFAALGYGFHDRGARTDEIIDILRVAWREDPSSYAGEHYEFAGIRVLPKPAHDIPIWVGGTAKAAHRRAIERGDGYQLIGVTPEEAAPVVAAIRAERPDPAFTISLRTGWDPQGMEPERITDERVAYAEAGVQHVVSAPWRSDLPAWLRSMELLAELALDD